MSDLAAGSAAAPAMPRRKARAPRPWGRRALTALVVVWVAALIMLPMAALARGTAASGFKAVAGALAAPAARHAFMLTLWITVVSVIVNTLFGVVLAIVLARQSFRGKLLVQGLLDLPLSVSPVVSGFMFIVLLGPKGWLGQWFEAAGVRIVFALPGMILATMFVTLPFVTREVLPVLVECGLEPEEAARTLGANGWQTFWRVTLPTVRWGLAYGIMLTVARALGEFGAVLVVSGSIIGKTQTATLFVHQEYTDFHYAGAFAASLVLAAVSFALLLAMEIVRKKVRAGHDAPADGFYSNGKS